MRCSLLLTTALLAGCLARPQVTVLSPPCPSIEPPAPAEFAEPVDPYDARTYPEPHGVNRARHDAHREALEAWKEVRRSECPGA